MKNINKYKENVFTKNNWQMSVRWASLLFIKSATFVSRDLDECRPGPEHEC